jgi:hypothetical protein
VFFVFALACLVMNWSIRLIIIQPLARLILRGPQKKVSDLLSVAFDLFDDLLWFPVQGTSAAKQVEFESKLTVKVEKFSQTAMEQINYGVFT